MSTEHLETRREAEAALAARRELGPDYEDAIAASLVDRIEQLATRRGTPGQQLIEQRAADSEERVARKQSFVLAITSLGAGIPITAIGGTLVEPGLLGVLVSWAGIVGVNVVFARRFRRR